MFSQMISVAQGIRIQYAIDYVILTSSYTTKEIEWQESQENGENICQLLLRYD